jgi:hypothetical protein
VDAVGIAHPQGAVRQSGLNHPIHPAERDRCAILASLQSDRG